MKRKRIEKLDILLERIEIDLPVLLGEGLCGVYLYGSLTQDAFEPAESDIDCIVVTKKDLSETEFSSLGSWFERLAYTNNWATRLQMQFLVLNELITSGNGCLYQFGQWKRTGSDGNPIIWLNILKSGIVLYGLRPEIFVPEITPEMLSEALGRETRYLLTEINNPESYWRKIPKYRKYSILTLCRILYSHTTGDIPSKPVAASWAIERIPENLKSIVSSVVAGDGNDSPKIEDVSQFIEYVMKILSDVDHKPSTTKVS